MEDLKHFELSLIVDLTKNRLTVEQYAVDGTSKAEFIAPLVAADSDGRPADEGAAYRCVAVDSPFECPIIFSTLEDIKTDWPHLKGFEPTQITIVGGITHHYEAPHYALDSDMSHLFPNVLAVIVEQDDLARAYAQVWRLTNSGVRMDRLSLRGRNMSDDRWLEPIADYLKTIIDLESCEFKRGAVFVGKPVIFKDRQTGFGELVMTLQNLTD